MQALKAYKRFLVSEPPRQKRPVIEDAGKATGTSAHLMTASWLILLLVTPNNGSLFNSKETLKQHKNGWVWKYYIKDYVCIMYVRIGINGITCGESGAKRRVRWRQNDDRGASCMSPGRGWVSQGAERSINKNIFRLEMLSWYLIFYLLIHTLSWKPCSLLWPIQDAWIWEQDTASLSAQG